MSYQRQGGEVRANAFGAASETNIAGLAGGGFVVAWSDGRIVGQLYSSAGVAVGGNFQINAETGGGANQPDLTALDGGGFVATWTDVRRLEDGTASTGARAQIFSATGARVGNELTIDGAGAQHDVTAVALGDGGFVAIWVDDSPTVADASGSSIRAQRYSATGTAIGAVTTVNTLTEGFQLIPSAARLTDDGFVVSWNTVISDENGNRSIGNSAQRFTSNGFKTGGEFRLDDAATPGLTQAHLTGLTNGRFVATWEDTGDRDGSIGVVARVYLSSGVPLTEPFRVATTTRDTQYGSKAVALPDGGFTIVWEDNSAGSGFGFQYDIRAQRFDEAGARVGGEFVVNSNIGGNQVEVEAAALASGGFVVGWTTLPVYHSNLQVFVPSPPGVAFSGTGGPDVFVGGDGDDILRGGASDDRLSGGGADDLLDGGSGNDVIDGGAGNDTADYGAANTAVRVSLSIAGPQATSGAGRDTLIGIENLLGSTNNDTLTGDAGANMIRGIDGNDLIYGLDGNDLLFGDFGNDLLDGGAGIDIMDGSGGNDRYVVDNLDDIVIDAAGIDTVIARIDWTLAAGLENLELDVPRFDAMRGTGNAGNNRMVGGDGNNYLYGLGGRDTLVGGISVDFLYGGAGADTLTGGFDTDVFAFDTLGTAAERDLVRDFLAGTDVLQFDTRVFTALDFGAPVELAFGPRATTADQHLIYNRATGVLFYDADGFEGIAQVPVAYLLGRPELTADRILLVG